MAGTSTVIYTSLINPFCWWIWRYSEVSGEPRCCRTCAAAAVRHRQLEADLEEHQDLKHPSPSGQRHWKWFSCGRAPSQESSAPALAGALLPCLVLCVLTFLVPPISHQEKNEIGRTAVSGKNWFSALCPSLQWREESQLPGEGEGVHSCTCAATGFSGACSPNHSFSTIWCKHSLLARANLGCPFRIWAGQREAREKERERFLRLRTWHSPHSPLHAFRLGLPGSQPKLHL